MRAALGFLTLLPVGEPEPPGPGNLAVFPLVGGLLGLVWVAAGMGGEALGGPPVGAGMVLVVDLLATGALHLDGLADVADGAASRLPPHEAQTVMRDPRIGAVGAATLCTALLVRFALIAAALPTPAILIAAPAAGRAAMVWTLGRLPHTSGASAGGGQAGQLGASGGGGQAGGPSGSLGTALAHRAGLAVRAAAVALVAVVTAGAFALARHSPATVVAATAVAPALIVLVSEPAARWWSRRFGFLSGDAVGAVGVVTELVVVAGLLLAT
ncbi:MAG: adenosylcobinamide-GDP ribazoletransferase [Nitriliruptorales bacterium]